MYSNDTEWIKWLTILPRTSMLSSLCFTCSAIILLMDIRLSVMLLLDSTRLSLVAFLSQKTKQITLITLCAAAYIHLFVNNYFEELHSKKCTFNNNDIVINHNTEALKIVRQNRTIQNKHIHHSTVFHALTTTIFYNIDFFLIFIYHELSYNIVRTSVSYSGSLHHAAVHLSPYCLWLVDKPGLLSSKLSGYWKNKINK